MEGQTINIQAIINPISGVGSKRKIPKMIETAFAGGNCCVEISFTEYPGHASELTRKALDKGANCVIAVGGDGTVNEIARAMLHSGAVLGIIPKGSGNGLARELHIPMDVRRAIDLIVKGHVSTIDCCKANGRVFFCTCGVGFDSAVLEDVEPLRPAIFLWFPRSRLSFFVPAESALMQRSAKSLPGRNAAVRLPI